MKKYFIEKYDKFEYEFIKDSNVPEKELITCVFAFVKFENKIYLTKNHRGWELPGGHIEKGETLKEALDRELAEEVGTKIKSYKLFGYKKYHNYEKTKNRDGGFYPFPYSYILIYICEGTGENHKIDCSDTLDYGLFSIEESLNKVESKGNREIIEILENACKKID